MIVVSFIKTFNQSFLLQIWGSEFTLTLHIFVIC